MTPARECQYVVSCPCGAWFSRRGMTVAIPATVAEFLREHELHCVCSGPAHAPHVDVHTFGVAV